MNEQEESVAAHQRERAQARLTKLLNSEDDLIRCVETGDLFFQVKDAGDWIGANGSSVSQVLSGGKRSIRGLRFERTPRRGIDLTTVHLPANIAQALGQQPAKIDEHRLSKFFVHRGTAQLHINGRPADVDDLKNIPAPALFKVTLPNNRAVVLTTRQPVNTYNLLYSKSPHLTALTSFDDVVCDVSSFTGQPAAAKRAAIAELTAAGVEVLTKCRHNVTDEGIRGVRLARAKRTSVAILCVETGQHYASIALAALAMGTTMQPIIYACNHGAKARGCHWRRVPLDELDEQLRARLAREAEEYARRPMDQPSEPRSVKPRGVCTSTAPTVGNRPAKLRGKSSGRSRVHGFILAALVRPEDRARYVAGQLPRDETVQLRCDICEQTYMATLDAYVKRGHMCPDCAGDSRAMVNAMADEDFKRRYLAGQVRLNDNERTVFRCRCGEVFEASARQFLYDGARRCRRCARVVNEEELLINEVVCEADPHVETLLRSRLFVPGDEVDVAVPSHALGIEYNGSFWHKDDKQHPPTYHRDKFLRALTVGVRLVSVFEPEWLADQHRCLGMVRTIVAQPPVDAVRWVRDADQLVAELGGRRVLECTVRPGGGLTELEPTVVEWLVDAERLLWPMINAAVELFGVDRAKISVYVDHDTLFAGALRDHGMHLAGWVDTTYVFYGKKSFPTPDAAPHELRSKLFTVHRVGVGVYRF